MTNVFQKLDFNIIIDLLQKYLNTIGKTKLSSINFSTDLQWIDYQLSATNEFVDIISNHNFPFDNLFDLRPQLNKAKLPNSFLSAQDLLKLWLSLDTIRKIKNFFNEKNKNKFPNLYKLASNLKNYPILISLIKKIIDHNGNILDSASKELTEIRQKIKSKYIELQNSIDQIIKSAQKKGILDPNTSATLRQGHFLIPVPVHYRNLFPGIIRDQSASGKTLFIEPHVAVNINNQISDLLFEEKREITKILTNFTNSLRPYIPDLLNNYDILAELDFLHAKALLAIQLDAHKPIISNKPEINLINARHPVLFVNFKKNNKKLVPLNIYLNHQTRIILISGPNAGGKSVALKTVGLIQLMLQTGFLVPTSPNSTIGIFDNIFVDIGDEQSIENDLSTYTSRLINLKNILSNASPNSLILIDEFGAGTDPTFGGAIAEAALQIFLEKNFKAVITTHYSNLKLFAANNSGIENAAMLFDSKKLKPLYQLQIGRPGSSFAFEIAQNIGLPQELISLAKQKIGQNHINFDKILLQIEQQHQQLAQYQQQIKQLKRQLKDNVTKYRQEYEKILRQKKQIIEQANKQADQILAQANKLVEHTIKQIKEANAEKNKTKIIRKNFEKQKKHFNSYRTNLQKQIESKLQENLKKQNKLKSKQLQTLSPGDYVLHPKTGLKGQIINIKDNTALILAGNLKTFIKINELEKLPNDQIQQIKASERKPKINYNLQSSPSFISALDVRGLRSDEAIKKVIKFIDAAIVANSKEVRILHGTGEGILRKNIRLLLKNYDQILWFGDADPRFGGPGVTVIKFK